VYVWLMKKYVDVADTMITAESTTAMVFLFTLSHTT